MEKENFYLEEKPGKVKKYYAIRKGKKTGITFSWDSCKALVHGFAGAEYKSFPTEEEALQFLGKKAGQMEESVSKTETGVVDEGKTSTVSKEDLPYAFVDGSYNIATKTYGFGGFFVDQDGQHVLQGSGQDEEMASMRNVAGEVLGAMAAVKYAMEHGIQEICIYYDYLGIEMWATNSWKTNKEATKAYKKFMQESGVKIHFEKVAAHTGVWGNEEADRLAKEAVGIL